MKKNKIHKNNFSRHFLFFTSFLFLLSLSSCNGGVDDNAYYTVNFDLNTPSGLNTTTVNEQSIKYGNLVEKPIVTVTNSNPDNYRIEGWYDLSSVNKDEPWDFDIYPVKKNLTLTAKWNKMYTVKFYLEGNFDSPVYETYVKPGHKVNNCDDKVAGYKIDGYYTNKEFTSDSVFDFSTPINSHLSLYLKTDGMFYLSAETMNRNFNCFSASTNGSTAGNLSLVTDKNGETSLSANFGYSVAASNGSSDPYIGFIGANINIVKSQIITIKMKNYGEAKQIGFYFVGKDQYGNFVGEEDFNATNNLYYTFTDNEKNMNEDSPWLYISFELARDKEAWRKMTTLNKIRIESVYVSKDSKDNSNVFLINEITSKNVPEYDSRNPLINLYTIDEQLIYSSRIQKGDKLNIDVLNNFTAGYKSLGYYYDKQMTRPVDFTTSVNEDVSIYVNYQDSLYFSSKAIASRFIPVESGPSSNGKITPTKGSVTYNETYNAADVNFGISAIGDPHIYITNCYIFRNNKNNISIKLKNLGKCTNLALYWAGIQSNGIEVENFTVGYEAWPTNTLTTNMKESDDYITFNIDLSGNSKWTCMDVITKFRLQASYVSTSNNDYSNRMLIDSIYGW